MTASLEFLEAHTHHLKTQFFAVYTPIATLTARIVSALRDILNLLKDFPLIAYAWHCHRGMKPLPTAAVGRLQSFDVPSR